MPLDAILALIGFAFVMSVSPGPSNILLLASGANFGLARTVPLILGISFGFLTMVLGVGLGVARVLEAYPVSSVALRIACTVYILWLAVKMFSHRGSGLSRSDNKIDKPFTFLQAAGLQLVNPKAWTVALIVTVTYLPPEASLSSLALLLTLFAAVNIPAISIWAISGHALRDFLGEENRMNIFNKVMAILLVAAMLPAILSVAQ